jgi:predicted  nucleic acid-binding Zn-ribbon protein
MENGQQPATKADIKALHGDIEALHGDIDGLREQIRDTETKLLTAFYDFAKANQQRLAQLEISDGTLTRRIGILEDRLLEVEKRLNMPPAA